MNLTEDEASYLDRHEGEWVRVTPKLSSLAFTGSDTFVGRVIGWHWYDGVVLHVQPPPKVAWQPEPYRVAFQFDTIEILSGAVA